MIKYVFISFILIYQVIGFTPTRNIVNLHKLNLRTNNNKKNNNFNSNSVSPVSFLDTFRSLSKHNNNNKGIGVNQKSNDDDDDDTSSLSLLNSLPTKNLLSKTINTKSTSKLSDITTTSTTDTTTTIASDDPAQADDVNLWRFATFVLCIIWATNFPIIKVIYDEVPSLDPSLFLSLRFTIASLFFIPSFFQNFKNKSIFLLQAFAVGLTIFPGHFGQSMGLMYSSADKGAFICSLSVVWVAMLDSFIKRKFDIQTTISAVVAVCGTALLELQGSSPPTSDDLWFLLQPVGFGTGYILLERLLKKYPGEEYVQPTTGMKMLSMSFATTFWAISKGHTFADITPLFDSQPAMISMAYVSIVTTALAIGIQSYAFKKVSATDSSIILASEPVWAAGVASIVLGEQLGLPEMIGGGLIIGACVINELNLVNRFLKIDNTENDQEEILIE